jgi:hypothetical protein
MKTKRVFKPKPNLIKKNREIAERIAERIMCDKAFFITSFTIAGCELATLWREDVIQLIMEELK